MQHCRHIETQYNHVVTGAYILIRAPTEELDNSVKAQAKLYGPVHETFVFIAYASNEGLDEPTHLRSITIAFAARTR